eukprot:2836038-Rhodomonas_salina.1
MHRRAQALQRNIHIAAMAPSGDTTIDSLPPAAAARPPRIHQIAHLPSSADLEALLAGAMLCGACVGCGCCVSVGCCVLGGVIDVATPVLR